MYVVKRWFCSNKIRYFRRSFQWYIYGNKCFICSQSNYHTFNRLIAFEYLEVFQPYLLCLKHYCFKIVMAIASNSFLCTCVRNLNAKQHVTTHIYCFFLIFWQQIWTCLAKHKVSVRSIYNLFHIYLWVITTKNRSNGWEVCCFPPLFW